MNFLKWSGVKGLDKRGGVNYRSEEAFEKQHPTCHSRNHLKGSKKGKKSELLSTFNSTKNIYKFTYLFLAGGGGL